ncbi:response regulator [Pelagicoccus mobilis]|uniref:Response regulator transcription factor n=1 Tax=Pelagicoccus mobilis TaxID=415221 RepID=A0A934VPY0_9BACT|nr:response regulator transcription factor [Pelagicoccus mobilis]MBK1875993.1 response regulator transcription factor [Pelagicoccus mobilis]
MSRTIEVIIVEDNESFTKSLKRTLAFNSDMACTGSFNSVEDFLDTENEDTREPHIALLDIHLPGKSGLTLVPHLKENYPNTKILVLTQDDDYHTTLEAIRLGVSGYVLKNADLEDIERAIREVNDGGCVIDPQLSRLVLDALDSKEPSKDSTLSNRERQVLELLAMGLVKKEVADRLNLSYYTVSEYTDNIYKKLQSPNAAAAVATAIRKGLI